MSIDKHFYKAKSKVFLTILVIIFSAELLIMLLLQFMTIKNHYIEGVFDSLLLTIITAPFIYHFMLKKLLDKNAQLLVDLKRKADGLDITALVSETNAQGKITFANEHFCQVAGYKESELLGKDHRILNSGTHSKEFWTNVWTTIKAGNIWRGDVCNKAKDGSLYWVDATIFPMKDQHGNIAGFSSVRINITERESIKEKLKYIAHEAEELAKSKSLFLANMSHEIRTPMNGVIGMTEILSETELTKEQDMLVSSIKSSGDHLLTIINDILDFSKIESNKIELENKSFHLKGLIEDVFYLFSSIASQKHLNFSYTIDEKIPEFLNGDTVKLRQILSNFISNAIKFTHKKGSVILEIKRLPKQDDMNHYIEFLIEDTGIGIDKKNQSKLFDAFSQADISNTREFGGTGLGLAICSKLVEKMKGKISLKSESEKGTKITVALPFKKGAVPSQNDLNKLSNKSLDVINQSNKASILLVEDNIINQKVVSIMLQKLNYNLDIASNGVEALEMIEKNGIAKYGLIFMDMQMPKLDGVSTTIEILKFYGERSPSIVAMTANVSYEDKQKCLEAGMLSLVSKPINKQNLINALEAYYKDQ